MKKKNFAIAASIIMAVTGTTLFAQTTGATDSPSTEKAISLFENQFGTSVQPAIYSGDNGSIIFKAAVNSRAVTSVFNKRGNWVYSLTRFPSQSLSRDVIDMVQEDYDTKEFYITGMEQVDQPGQPTVYVVHLKGADSFKTLRVSDTGIEEIAHYQSA